MNPAGQRKPPPFLSLGPSCAVPHPASSGRSLVRSVSDRKAFGAGDQPDSAALPTWGYDFDPEVASRVMAAKARLGSQGGVTPAPARSAGGAAQARRPAPMAEDLTSTTEPLRGRAAQVAPLCWMDLERLIEKFQQFTRLLIRSAAQPPAGNARVLAAYAGLGCELLSDRLQDPDREQLGRLAVDAIVGHLAVMGHRLGGAVMPAAIYFRFRKAWLEGLQAIEALRLAPAVSMRINLAPLVQSLGGQEAPMELLFNLMELSASQPCLSNGLRRGVASGLLATRYAGGASTSADLAVLDWLLCDLACRACPSLQFAALPSERSFQVLRGALDAFLSVGASPLARLRRVMRHLTEENHEQLRGAIARCLAAAIDCCGQALSATSTEAVRMRAIALTLLQAWAEGQELAPYPMIDQLIISLGNREAISWLGESGEAVGAGGQWGQGPAASLIVNCIDDLETSEHRQAARRALDYQLSRAAAVQFTAPIADVPPYPRQPAASLMASQAGFGEDRICAQEIGRPMAQHGIAPSRVDGMPSAKRKGLGE